MDEERSPAARTAQAFSMERNSSARSPRRSKSSGSAQLERAKPQVEQRDERVERVVDEQRDERVERVTSSATTSSASSLAVAGEQLVRKQLTLQRARARGAEEPDRCLKSVDGDQNGLIFSEKAPRPGRFFGGGTDYFSFHMQKRLLQHVSCYFVTRPTPADPKTGDY